MVILTFSLAFVVFFFPVDEFLDLELRNLVKSVTIGHKRKIQLTSSVSADCKAPFDLACRASCHVNHRQPLFET